MITNDHLLVTAPAPLPVPAAYAEKAMASIMQLHGELMDEKEKRVELFRRLMEKEQALAELKMYVKLLEERAAPPTSAEPPVVEPAPSPVRPSVRREQPPPVPPRSGQRPEGWKVW